MGRLYYLAYGSNLHPLRLAARTPSSRVVGPVHLPGWRLAFHKRGDDGSGKCNIVRTGDPGDNVHGALYEIASHERAILDRAEGPGYRVDAMRVWCAGLSYRAFVYIARKSHVDETARPYTWYRDLVLHGARHHGAPAAYCAQLEGVATLPDADTDRHRYHADLLARLNARRSPGAF